MMPIKPENRHRYPPNWKAIVRHIKARAHNKCEFCGAANYKPHPETGATVILTVAHLNHLPEDCRDENLKALCQKCHNGYDVEHRKETRQKCK